MKKGFCFLSGQGGVSDSLPTQSSPATPNYRAEETSKSAVPGWDASLKVKPKGKNKFRTIDNKGTVTVVSDKEAAEQAANLAKKDAIIASFVAQVNDEDPPLGGYQVAPPGTDTFEEIEYHIEHGLVPVNVPIYEIGEPSEHYMYAMGSEIGLYKMYLTDAEYELLNVTYGVQQPNLYTAIPSYYR